MAWINDFLEKLLPVKERNGPGTDAVVIDIPAELYYSELALYTATSLIGNAISRAEIRTYINGVPVQNEDYYLLNVSPNENETSSLLWHKVINKMIRKGEALVVEIKGKLYCADTFNIAIERPILGNIYSGVTIGPLALNMSFNSNNVYHFKMDNVKVKSLVDGMYAHYGKILTAAGEAFKQSNARKYKLHIEGTRAGDPDFNEEFEGYIKKQLKTYLSETTAVYPEFDGYKLEGDPLSGGAGKTADDYIKIKNDIFKTFATAFHIPDALFTGNVTSLNDVLNVFLTLGVDPYADTIQETLNKRAGIENFVRGNKYKVQTSSIKHRDIFELCDKIYNLIGSGRSYDEIMRDMGEEPLNTEWSTQHFLSKNFVPAKEILNNTADIVKGGEKNEE